MSDTEWTQIYNDPGTSDGRETEYGDPSRDPTEREKHQLRLRRSLRSGTDSGANDMRREEPLDSSFSVVQNGRRFFTVGRIFKVLWSEPSAPSLQEPTSVTGRTRYGEKIHTKIRRFAVVASLQGHCSCVRLTTYEGRGTTKLGVNPTHHAAIIPYGSTPRYLPGEDRHKLIRPFQAIIEGKSETLDATTRIDFSRVYTIEYNIKVAKVGRIMDESLKRFVDCCKSIIFPSTSGSSDYVSQEPVPLYHETPDSYSNNPRPSQNPYINPGFTEQDRLRAPSFAPPSSMENYYSPNPQPPQSSSVSSFQFSATQISPPSSMSSPRPPPWSSQNMIFDPRNPQNRMPTQQAQSDPQYQSRTVLDLSRTNVPPIQTIHVVGSPGNAQSITIKDASGSTWSMQLELSRRVPQPGFLRTDVEAVVYNVKEVIHR